jgi:citrate lyase subunit beta/citryl-CoA lyase
MDPRLWTSLLFVPAGSDRLLASAIRHRPDAVILDLEDGVAQAAKPGAREALARQQQAVRDAGLGVVIRTNAGLAALAADLQAIDPGAACGVMVPKCVDDRLLVLARDGLVAQGWRNPVLLALVESPAALWALPAIAAAPGVAGLMFGPEDYAAELGVDPDGGGLDVPAALVAAACAGRGLLSIGLPGSIGQFKDLEAYARKVACAKALGFRAAAAIHPTQLPVIRDGLSPTADEVAKARRVVEAFEEAIAAGRGAVGLDGEMLDAPVVERARRLLARARPGEA